VERSFLLKAWLVVAAIVVVAVTAISLALTSAGTAPAGGARREPVAVQQAPSSPSHGPIVVNGTVCGQCR
jgi:hypothetical protein